MEKKRRKKPDLIKQAEQIAARAWRDEGFECPYDGEVKGMVNRLGEVGNLCLKCSEERNLSPRLYREIKLILTLWRGLMEQELEENEDTK